MKHTPGPWKSEIWNYEHSPRPHRDLTVVCREFRIAVIDWDEGKGSPFTIPADQALANAAAISAVPEMLAALQSFVALCPSDEGLGGHAPIGAFFVVANQARAAIKKATTT